MEEMPKNYDPSTNEPAILQKWLDGGYYKRREGVGDCTVTIPPPNVTGKLHMGHATDDSIQDAIIRMARMRGKSTRWVLGTDHAGIATQTKVDKKLKSEGISRLEIGRDKFVDACWDWTHEYGGIIVEQIKRMGCSVDFDNERFTMDEDYAQAVRKVFCDWYHDGLIYRGKRIVNWCPNCTTAISDDEAEYKDEKGHLWHLRYPLTEPVNGQDYIVVATTRPETMLGDTGVAVSPKDPEKAAFVGKTVKLPIVDREIPIFEDWHVDANFGSGFVKVTPAHDPNDYAMGQAHDLPQINIFDEHAVVVEGYGEFTGMNRDECREAVVKWFEEHDLLDHVEDLDHSVMHCYRCDAALEPWLSEQWFVAVDKLKGPALDAVNSGKVTFHPARWTQTYTTWMENLKDWCISRQLWWGHRIPAYYCDDCGETVVTIQGIEKCPKCGGHHLKADKDILDVWWDSGVSWKAVCEYRPELEYPADVYLEGSDQHRGWFQSSLLTSVGANGHAPYKAVVSQGFTLDGQGRKMSKSLGNVIDPNKVCDEMGADIIRLWVASVDTSSDVSIDHEILARTSDAYRRFRNTLRFLLSELEGQFEPETDGVAFADLLPLDKLMVARLTQVQAEVDDAYASYEFPRAYRALYDFVVTELSNVYLDALKDRLYCDKPGSLERRSAQTVLAELFSMLMRDLQPILSYTVDEAMAYAPAGCVDHQKYAALLDWYKSPITVDEANEFEGVLEASLELRSAVTKALEDARSAGTFTKSQQVRVKAVVPAEMYALLTGDKAVDLAEFYIVSDVELTQGEELSVCIDAAEGECCDRCWNYRTTVGEYNGHAHICKRCADAL